MLSLSAHYAGEIPPGGTAVFNWSFQPLEARTYQAVLPLTLGDGSQHMLSVSGRGFHPRHTGQAEPLPQEEARWVVSWLHCTPLQGCSRKRQASHLGKPRLRIAS